MKLHGKIVAKEIKDFGKGKDAEAKEVGVVTARLDGAFRGRLIFEPPDRQFAEMELGDKVTVSLEIAQQKLDLNGRAKERREAAEAKH